jgi:hypothetical protein
LHLSEVLAIEPDLWPLLTISKNFSDFFPQEISEFKNLSVRAFVELQNTPNEIKCSFLS